MSSDTQSSVKRRRVFYIPGYDPIHPRRYRELYRSEGAAQSQISGYELSLQGKSGGAAYGWMVDATIKDQETKTEFDVLVWSDIVRQSMNTSIAATYAQMMRTAWVYISSGTLARLMRLRKGPVIAALYPVGMLILQALLAVLLAGLVYAVTTWILSDLLGSVASNGVALVAGGALAIVLLQWFKRRDNKLFVYYLMHDYSYSAASWGSNPPELEARIAAFTQQIADALAEPYDEVLVVGHSSGAHLGVSILADLVRSGVAQQSHAALSFLTLGQVVPMVSFLPDAHRLRADLQYLSARDELTWVDVTAPGDGCAFALCDPVSVSGVAQPDKRWPLVFSAAFSQTLSPELWKTLKRRYFRLHFQYLCAFDRPKDYDYFQITAGPKTLGSRYKNRPASRSRIDYAVSKYTSVAA